MVRRRKVCCNCAYSCGSSAEAIWAVRQHVLDLVSRDIAMLLRPLNEHVAIHILPNELLAVTFGHLGIHDCFTAARVCHAWREVALATPSIWADSTDFGVVSPRLPLAIQRAKSCPLVLDFSFAASHMSLSNLSIEVRCVLSCLQVRFGTIRSLRIALPKYLLDQVTGVLGAPAPLLESFTMDVQPFDFHQSLRSDIFCGVAPVLSHVRLNGPVPRTASAAFSAVRRLSLCLSSVRPDLWPDLNAIVPRLEEYSVTLDRRHQSGAHTAIPVPPAPNLRVLAITDMPNPGLLQALPYVTCPRVTLSRSDLNCFFALVDDLPDVAHFVVRFTVRDPSQRDTACAAIDSARQMVRATHSGSLNGGRIYRELMPRLAAQLQTLVLEVAYANALNLPRVAFPQLTHLGLVVGAYSGDMSCRLYDLPPHFLTAPRLSVIRLTTTDRAPHFPKNTRVSTWIVDVVQRFMAERSSSAASQGKHTTNSHEGITISARSSCAYTPYRSSVRTALTASGSERTSLSTHPALQLSSDGSTKSSLGCLRG